MTVTSFDALQNRLPDTTLSRRIHYWVQLFFRYFIALQMFIYSFAKLLGTQFTPKPSTLAKPVGDLTGFELTWTFYGYSHTYGYFIVAAQIAAGLFLLFRRTARLGILLVLGIMGNIVMLDITYGIPVAIPMAVLLLVMGLYLFLSDLPAFLSYAFGKPFLENETVPAFAKRNFATGLRLAAIPVMLLGTFALISTLKTRLMYESSVFGAWSVENSDVEHVYFDFGNDCSALSVSGETLDGICSVDEAAQRLSLDFKKIDKEALKLAYYEYGREGVEAARQSSPSILTFEGSYTLNGDSLTLISDAQILILEPLPFIYGEVQPF